MRLAYPLRFTDAKAIWDALAPQVPALRAAYRGSTPTTELKKITAQLATLAVEPVPGEDAAEVADGGVGEWVLPELPRKVVVEVELVQLLKQVYESMAPPKSGGVGSRSALAPLEQVLFITQFATQPDWALLWMSKLDRAGLEEQRLTDGNTPRQRGTQAFNELRDDRTASDVIDHVMDVLPLVDGVCPSHLRPAARPNLPPAHPPPPPHPSAEIHGGGPA